MIEYIIAENPDDRILQKAADIMNKGALVCLPTDTNWIIAASTDSKKGVDALYLFRGADKNKHFSIICNSISEASRYGLIYDGAFKSIKKAIPGPYTFILSPTKDLPQGIKGYRKDKEIGIRVPDSTLCRRLVEVNGKPIVATAVTIDKLKEISPSSFIEGIDDLYSYQIEEIMGHILGMIIDPGEFEFCGRTSIISYATEDGLPEVIREGAGDTSYFV